MKGKKKRNTVLTSNRSVLGIPFLTIFFVLYFFFVRFVYKLRNVVLFSTVLIPGPFFFFSVLEMVAASRHCLRVKLGGEERSGGISSTERDRSIV